MDNTPKATVCWYRPYLFIKPNFLDPKLLRTQNFWRLKKTDPFSQRDNSQLSGNEWRAISKPWKSISNWLLRWEQSMPAHGKKFKNYKKGSFEMKNLCSFRCRPWPHLPPVGTPTPTDWFISLNLPRSVKHVCTHAPVPIRWTYYVNRNRYDTLMVLKSSCASESLRKLKKQAKLTDPYPSQSTVAPLKWCWHFNINFFKGVVVAKSKLEWVTRNKKQRKLPLTGSLPNACTVFNWAKPKLRTRKSTRGSHVGSREQSTWTISTCCLSVYIRRRL